MQSSEKKQTAWQILLLHLPPPSITQTAPAPSLSSLAPLTSFCSPSPTVLSCGEDGNVRISCTLIRQQCWDHLEWTGVDGWIGGRGGGIGGGCRGRIRRWALAGGGGGGWRRREVQPKQTESSEFGPSLGHWLLPATCERMLLLRSQQQTLPPDTPTDQLAASSSSLPLTGPADPGLCSRSGL